MDEETFRVKLSKISISLSEENCWKRTKSAKPWDLGEEEEEALPPGETAEEEAPEVVPEVPSEDTPDVALIRLAQSTQYTRYFFSALEFTSSLAKKMLKSSTSQSLQKGEAGSFKSAALKGVKISDSLLPPPPLMAFKWSIQRKL